ncbi:MAG: Jag N-terminal domain-containing protein [Proteobacteria bacterium]|nr:Jag N-terminal domain-containing protein [Pseudomonadota bacterium]
MSPCFEFEDKTLEKAVQKACEKLKIPKAKLKHDVISYGSTGIFGLVGTKKARIRVTVPDPLPPSLPPAAPETKDTPDTPQQAEIDQTAPAAFVEENEADKTSATDECSIYPAPVASKEAGREVLQRILDSITTDARISVEEKSDRILFNVQGGNSAVLIGKRGQTLEAIQYLVEKVYNKSRGDRVRIQVDVEGYLKNRRANLQKLAGRLAEKVKRTGKPATIGQMNAHDRRIVHIALRDNSAVRTQSLGDGYLRKLVIFPQKNALSKKKPTNKSG